MQIIIRCNMNNNDEAMQGGLLLKWRMIFDNIMWRLERTSPQVALQVVELQASIVYNIAKLD